MGSCTATQVQQGGRNPVLSRTVKEKFATQSHLHTGEQSQKKGQELADLKRKPSFSSLLEKAGLLGKTC